MMTVEINNLLANLQNTHIDNDETTLSFAGKSMKLDTEEDARVIADSIREKQVMEVLNLSGNTFGVPAAQAVGKALVSHPELRRAIWHDIFTSRLRSEIPKAMESLCDAMIMNHTKLVELNLSDNAFGPDGVKSVENLVKSPVCHTLEVLKFNNMGLGIGGGTLLASALCQLHESSVKAGHPLRLKVFIAGRNRLENKGGIELAKAFKAIGSLEEVSMPQNGIYHEGITAIADALSININLHTLNLNDNTVTARGAKAIVKAMKEWKKLNHFDLGDCLLKNAGGRLIAGALNLDFPELEVVNLSSNELGSECGKIILSAVKNKERLKIIDLNANTFGNGCADIEELAKSFGLLSSLQSLEDDDGTDEEEEDEGDTDIIAVSSEEENQNQHKSPKTIIPEKGVTASSFRENPTSSKLLGLGNDADEILFKEYQSSGLLGSACDIADEVMILGKTIPPIEHPESSQLLNLASKCADKLLTAAFISNTYGKVDTSTFTNRLLERLGLIKSEELHGKARDCESSTNGSLLLLKYACKQSYFPKDSRDVLQFFLSRPCPKLDPFADMKHKLLQALYQS